MHKAVLLTSLALLSAVPALAFAQDAPPPPSSGQPAAPTLFVEQGAPSSPASAAAAPQSAPTTSAAPSATSAGSAMAIPSDSPLEVPAASPVSNLRNRFELAARFGYGRALGSDASNTSQIGAHLPIVVEAGWRSSPRISVLFGFQYAPLFRSGCLDGKSCGGRALKGSATVVYHFKPGASFDPWFGYSMGYESIQLNGPLQYEVRNALEIINLQFGGDWLLSSATSESPIRLGPFVSLSADMPVGARSRNQSAHSWFVLGVRGTLDL